MLRKALTTVVALGVAAAIPAAGKLSRDDRIAHALDRLTFGARPGDADAVRRIGLKKWIELQLHPERIPENPLLEQKLKPLATLSMTPAELVKAFPPAAALRGAAALARANLAPDQLEVLRDGSPAERRELIRSLSPEQRRALAAAFLANSAPAAGSSGPGAAGGADAPRPLRPVAAIAAELIEAKLYRALYSRRQLYEVLADFWFNHFNVNLDKGADRYLVTSYERDAIRPHVLGKFGDLLLATAGHPAMLFYLDNWQSSAEDSSGRRPAGRRRGLNENYARELLELHTLGVDGGYTQKDVMEVARCFTGWTIRAPRAGGGYAFNLRLHDQGEKTVLGHRIPPGGGREDALAVIGILAAHPSTARWISRKLAVRFVSDNPPDALVERMASAFRRSGGDIPAVLRSMFDSKEFWSEAAYRAKLKSPFEMVVSAARAMDAEVDKTQALARALARLGQPLYRKAEPTGYSGKEEEWANSASLLARFNFAQALASNRVAGVQVDPARTPQVPGISAETRAAAAKAGPGGAAAILLASPEFQRR